MLFFASLLITSGFMCTFASHWLEKPLQKPLKLTQHLGSRFAPILPQRSTDLFIICIFKIKFLLFFSPNIYILKKIIDLSPVAD